MALGGFASGALVAAPVAAVLTWLAVSWEQHVDLRVERDTVAARADRAAFNTGFASDWSRATGQPQAGCDAQGLAEAARLRKRVADLETKLQGSRADRDADAAELRNIAAGAHK